MSRSRPPKTLREMAEEGAGGKGIRCVKCGCRDWRVETTRRHDGAVVRYRICRACKARLTTFETPVK